jgi:hypothetical protein
MKLWTYDEVVAHLSGKNKPISLLMGNGFSMAYDRAIFSYNALYDFLSSKEDELLNKLFGVIKTKNFELVMQQLDTTLLLLDAFGGAPELKVQIKSACNKLQETLLKSVQELHPEHVYKLPEEKSNACSEFLKFFVENNGHVFTTNYDLLLYWVLMRAGMDAGDGFGREVTNPFEVSNEVEAELSDLFWGPNVASQSVHYLHGALHLFDVGSTIEKEQYDADGYLLENITRRLNEGEYPIFVTAGDGSQKLEHIRHNRYLSHCYDKLSELDGYLVTFGFNFGKYDDHIIDAINRACKGKSKNPPKLWSVYIGVYSDADIEHIKSIEHKFYPKVRIYDAKTAKVWG